MKAWNLLLSVLVGFVGLSVSDRVWAEKHPIANAEKSVWQVEYDDGHPNTKNDFAVRLLIDPAENDNNPNKVVKLSAKLYRYGRPTGGSGPKKYKVKKLNSDDEQFVQLHGHVPSAPSNGGHWKKAVLRLVLVGTYYDDENIVHLVKVRGTFYPGTMNRKYEVEKADRTDDRLVFTVVDQPLKSPGDTFAVQGVPGLGLTGANPFDFMMQGSGVPCDDAPPMDAAQEVSAIPAGGTEAEYESFVYAPEYVEPSL